MKLENNKVFYFDRDGEETTVSTSALKYFNENYKCYSNVKGDDYMGSYILKKFEEIKQSFPEAFL